MAGRAVKSPAAIQPPLGQFHACLYFLAFTSKMHASQPRDSCDFHLDPPSLPFAGTCRRAGSDWEAEIDVVGALRSVTRSVLLFSD
jgi:hypothetical protein